MLVTSRCGSGTPRRRLDLLGRECQVEAAGHDAPDGACRRADV